MDGARETSQPAAAMKTERSSLRRLSRSPSPQLLAPSLGSSSFFWRADAAATRRRRRIPGETLSGLTTRGLLPELGPCPFACGLRGWVALGVGIKTPNGPPSKKKRTDCKNKNCNTREEDGRRLKGDVGRNAAKGYQPHHH
ncbi:hypothetical protein PFLUV_G00090530 [Perca fluviatilis]|uniref:Uncharacterized protein n=1 Tax=Perca fluviatilis TaxID=8168 RepID=A0A6A5FAN5_PERFL|nr:hypothetical protein PFLUV_G00090530 [Perca fluviatilis]